MSEFGLKARAKLANPAISGAPEDQLRAPLEQLIQGLAELGGLPSGAVRLVGETPLGHLQTRPDYAVSVNNALIGFIEIKAPGKGSEPRQFNDPHDKEQWAKLKSLPNLLYTDGNGFSLWRDGESAGKPALFDGDIGSAGAKLAPPPNLLALVTDFLKWAPEAPKSPAALAKVSARLCRLLRDEVLEQMARGNESLKGLASDWRKLLFPNADDEQFADGYAQAVTFGLLMARALDIPLDGGIDLAALRLKKQNSLIGTALGLLTENDANRDTLKTSLGTLTRVLNEVNWHTISKDKADAWLYFYEDFLAVYDNKLRKATGSYYTPPQVVSAMVRLVDEALRGPLFERSTGLAHADVTIADPAVGTGTFLLGVLRQIAANVEADQGEGAVAPAVGAAAKRLFGFELQFGPFAVAQLRLLAEMRALMGADGNGAKAKHVPEVNLFITDTLGNPFVEEENLGQILEAVAKSRRDANAVKRGQPIMVVIGNPPYKNKAADLGGWIEQGSSGRSAPLAWWIPPASWGVGAHTHHLRNLYIYFWRWATLKVFGSGWNVATNEPETDRNGIVCFISAAGFLNGPAFQRMREDLRRDCSEVWVIDCSPEGHQPDVPTRIFPGVQQEICIVLAARRAKKDRNVPAQLRCLSLPLGKWAVKVEALADLSLDSSDWRQGPSEWREPFLPELDSAWASYASLSTFFAWAGSGVTPHRTWPISPDVESLERRWNTLRAETDMAKKAMLFHADRDREVGRGVKVRLGDFAVRPANVAQDQQDVVPPVRYAFRSFDRQWIVPDHRLLSMARPKLWERLSAKQVFLTALQRSSPKSGPALTISNLIPDLDHYKGSFGGRVYPLWSDAQATVPNIRPEALALLATTYGHSVSPEDVIAYIAAVMAHPAFTARFAKDLIRPGLRFPLTADAALFAEAVALGREVVWLHCYGERFADAAAGRPKGPPRLPKERLPFISAEGAIPSAPEPMPDDMRHDAATNRLHVGKGFIENVTKEMWDYDVSGKQVVWQWFSYRRRDRTKPIIGDRRPPSPLEKIQPEGWLAEYTTDLLDLLNVLGRVIALHPAQADLLARVCDGPLIAVERLRDTGLVETPQADAEADSG